MKGLVLSGGTGTRLRPFTYAMPKQLVPIANKPVLEYVIERVRDMGVAEIGVIVGSWSDAIVDVLGDGDRLGVSLTYIRQETPAGLADCVAISEDFLAEDDFVMYLGDCMLGEEVVAEAENFRQHRPDVHVVVSEVADPTGLGVVELAAGGTVIGLQEKPARPRSNLVLTGVYFFSPSVHRAVRSISPSARGELEITDAIQWMLDNGFEVRAGRFTGMYVDTGRVDDLLACNRLLLADLRHAVHGRVDSASELLGPVVVEAGATVHRSRLVGPVMIAAGCVIEDSTIGPDTVVGPDGVIRESAVRDCIVMAGARITESRDLQHSVIGRSAVVTGGSRQHSLIIGDECRVEVAV
ncbi:glucose-1-phosphate thymidylyltransferase [Nocardia noduli]|uniref:glucose-1-phosphate thymidylyltransferase n=1 Tax=Nocardia noduli TaxID=2815722 RepID=UPI001C2406EF|nr:glucose-1-phosphate thymidylyltransferase [Nocardia noduli]